MGRGLLRRRRLRQAEARLEAVQAAGVGAVAEVVVETRRRGEDVQLGDARLLVPDMATNVWLNPAGPAWPAELISLQVVPVDVAPRR